MTGASVRRRRSSVPAEPETHDEMLVRILIQQVRDAAELFDIRDLPSLMGAEIPPAVVVLWRHLDVGGRSLALGLFARMRRPSGRLTPQTKQRLMGELRAAERDAQYVATFRALSVTRQQRALAALASDPIPARAARKAARHGR